MTLSSAARQTAPPPLEPHRALPRHYSLRIPPCAFTMDGFRAWATSMEFPESVCATFLQGELIIDMSNEDPQTHVLVKGEIARVLANLCKELKNGMLYPDGVLVSHVAAGISNNPDGSFVKWETFESGQARLVPRGDEGNGYSEIEGTPDWVLEVLSDSSVDKDTRLLRHAYHRAGIPEYWIVDARGETLDFQILVRRKKAYTAATQNDGWQKSFVFEREFRLTREQTRMNLWEYTLRVRPLRKGRSV